MVFATMFTNQLAIADDSNYQRLYLKEGISIEVPRHWLVHSDMEKKNFGAASEAGIKGAGINYDTAEGTASLLAVSALPMPTGAKIRITVVRPLRFSGADLRAATTKDLKEIQAELAAEMSQAMKAIGGPQLLDLKVPQVVTIGGQSAFFIEYRRTDLHTPSPWTVRRYRIPVGDKLIEFTTSYREADAPIFKPILEHVKLSLKF